MPTLMQRAADWLGSKLQDAAGHAGTYRQGNRVSNSITATVAMHEYEVTGPEGVGTLVLSYDWTFVADELVIGDDAITPRPRDIWKATVNGTLETYEVLALGNRPCFERLDTSGILLLVHTKKIS